jgi:2-(1,2-epoxy-1,2-dihydrophenyl)acetyl-CoA isomerase
MQPRPQPAPRHDERTTDAAIRSEIADGVATITIDRPEKRNALTFPMLTALAAAVREADAAAQVRAVVLTGVPGAFCSGIDLAELSATDPDRRSTGPGEAGADGSPDRGLAILHCDTPVIAAVDGPAVGLGAELTLQCDLRVASPRAMFNWNFVRVGLVPDTGLGSWLLPRVIGLAATYELLLDGGPLEAERARALGYVSEVVEPDALATRARERAAALAERSPFAARRIKRLVRDGLSRRLDEHLRAHAVALEECFHSADHAEGVGAFLERRVPAFTGEES